jgi:zinc transporter
MTTSDELKAGEQPGLRFAALLDGRGGCTTNLDWDALARWRPEQGSLWVHLERDAPETVRWINAESSIDPIVKETLLADESRPRVEAIGDNLLLVLRGVNLKAAGEEVELVPIHIWIDANRAITLRDSDHSLNALRDIRLALAAERGPRSTGTLLVQIADKIVRDLEPVVDEMEEEVEKLEDTVISVASPKLRRDLADLRRRAIHLRRYLAPQREALCRLQVEETPLLGDRDRMRLGSVIDRVVRFLEDLDAIRDRTIVIHEELASQITERIAATSNRLTAVAALLLPPSLIAALLGANIGGIPGAGYPMAFVVVTVVILAVMAVQYLILKRIHWL